MEPWAAGHPERRASAAPPPLADPGTAGAAAPGADPAAAAPVPASGMIIIPDKRMVS